MDDEEILQLVADGELDPEDIEDFKDFVPEIQDMVVNGDISMDDAGPNLTLYVVCY